MSRSYGWSMRALAKLSWFALLLASCFRSSSGGIEAGTAEDRGGDEQRSQAGSGAVPASRPPNTATGGPPRTAVDREPSPAPVPDERDVPVSDEQAACLGLDQPACAACHLAPNGGGFFLRPRFAPPAPVDVIPVDSDQLVLQCGLMD